MSLILCIIEVAIALLLKNTPPIIDHQKYWAHNSSPVGHMKMTLAPDEKESFTDLSSVCVFFSKLSVINNLVV